MNRTPAKATQRVQISLVTSYAPVNQATLANNAKSILTTARTNLVLIMAHVMTRSITTPVRAHRDTKDLTVKMISMSVFLHRVPITPRVVISLEDITASADQGILEGCAMRILMNARRPLARTEGFAWTR